MSSIETPEGLSISETLSVNCILWIQSLDEDEIGPSRRILEDLEVQSVGAGLAVRKVSVTDRNSFLQLLSECEVAAEEGLRPILHFDMHGSEAEGLFLKPSGDCVSWKELIESLRSLNAATENNLICVFATCYAYQMLLELELSRATPAYVIIAPPKEVYVDFLEGNTARFYELLCVDGSVLEAFTRTLLKQMMYYHCQGMFLRALAQYITSYATGPKLELRVRATAIEKLKTVGIEYPSEEDIVNAQTDVRCLLEPGQHLIDLFAPKFLAGRPAKFDFEFLSTFVCKMLKARDDSSHSQLSSTAE